MADRKQGKGSQIFLSKTQVAKTGGFILPLFSAAEILVLKGLATGAASYLGLKVTQKVTGKSGKGAYIPEYEYQGSGTSPRNVKKKQKNQKRALSNIEISRQLKSIPHFRGVFMNDTLPNKIKENENGVINSDNSDGNGKHWIAYFNRNKYDKIYFFESF